MHALSFHRRRLQRIVWLTLVGWVFALASGVVNACLSAPAPIQRSGLAQQTSAGEVAHDVHLPAGDHRASEARAAAATQSPHDRSSASDSCQKFCDDEASALSKNLSPSADLPAPLIVAFVHWPPDALGASTAARWSHWQTAGQGPPLVIRFLRLTL